MNTAAAGGNAALVAMEEWSSGVLSGKLTGLHASPPPPGPMHEVRRDEGLILDPVYGGKAFVSLFVALYMAYRSGQPFFSSV
jgi:hypothetical protein